MALFLKKGTGAIFLGILKSQGGPFFLFYFFGGGRGFGWPGPRPFLGQNGGLFFKMEKKPKKTIFKGGHFFDKKKRAPSVGLGLIFFVFFFFPIFRVVVGENKKKRPPGFGSKRAQIFRDGLIWDGRAKGAFQMGKKPRRKNLGKRPQKPPQKEFFFFFLGGALKNRGPIKGGGFEPKKKKPPQGKRRGPV